MTLCKKAILKFKLDSREGMKGLNLRFRPVADGRICSDCKFLSSKGAAAVSVTGTDVLPPECT